jgi:uncharacterized protein with HEPN domain
MPRDYRLYLDDILQAIGSIREYIAEGSCLFRLGKDEIIYCPANSINQGVRT